MAHRGVLDRTAQGTGRRASSACNRCGGPTGADLRRMLGNGDLQRLHRAGLLRPKLRISQPGDRDEQEADRVADRIMRTPADPPGQMCASCAAGGLPCAACRAAEPPSLQREAEGARPAGPAAADGILAGLGPGRPLDAASRAFFEPRLGRDFGRVRVHADDRAAESARAVNALAYTVGRDLVFGEGRYAYAPETEEGRRLLAHELTHVVQQAGGADPGEPSAATPAISRTALALQRHDEEESEGAGERPLTRPEEIALSRSSPGEVAATASPPRISLYNFAIDSATLKDRHREALAEVASLIRRAGPARMRVMVVGHTDNSGEPAVNTPLSRRRAQTVQRALARLAGTDVLAEWAGENSPVATNDTVEGRSRNRRVDILFLPPPGLPPPPPALRVFCLGGQIACATLDFIRERGGRYRILTAEERRQAVDMEHRILIREFAALAPRPTPVDPDAHFRWIAEMRRQAEQRVSDALTGTVR